MQERIDEDPAILGVGELILKDQERSQPGAGRLDLLFQDPDSNLRYEVEIQLGKTDECHIFALSNIGISKGNAILNMTIKPKVYPQVQFWKSCKYARYTLCLYIDHCLASQGPGNHAFGIPDSV